MERDLHKVTDRLPLVTSLEDHALGRGTSAPSDIVPEKALNPGRTQQSAAVLLVSGQKVKLEGSKTIVWGFF